MLAASWLEEVGESIAEQASSPARPIVSWACLRPTVLGQKSREEGIALRARGSEAESQKPRLLLSSVCKSGLGAWSLGDALRSLAARLLGARSISHLAETAFLQPDSRLGAILGGCKLWFILGKIYRQMYNLQKKKKFFLRGARKGWALRFLVPSPVVVDLISPYVGGKQGAHGLQHPGSAPAWR